MWKIRIEVYSVKTELPDCGYYKTHNWWGHIGITIRGILKKKRGEKLAQ
jgi:hypothetical protein